MTDPKTDAAPHDCTECGEPAYIPFHGPARCTNRGCARYDADIWKEHTMSLPDEETGVELEIDEDAPTMPSAPIKSLTYTSPWLPLDAYPNPDAPLTVDARIAKAKTAMRDAVDASDYWRLRDLTRGLENEKQRLTEDQACAKL